MTTVLYVHVERILLRSNFLDKTTGGNGLTFSIKMTAILQYM